MKSKPERRKKIVQSAWKKVFLAKLRQGLSAAASADAAGITRQAAYKARARSPTFDRDWLDAEAEGSERIADQLVKAVVIGESRKLYNGKGELVEHETQQNARIGMWLLSKRDPSKYGERVTVDHTVALHASILDAQKALNDDPALVGKLAAKPARTPLELTFARGEAIDAEVIESPKKRR